MLGWGLGRPEGNAGGGTSDRINDKLTSQQALLDQKEADGKLTAEILGQKARRISFLATRPSKSTANCARLM
jgi:hypothetical protein